MIIFISGIGTDVGKTFVNMGLNALLMERGFKIISIKPIETGIESNSPRNDEVVVDSPCDAQLHAQNQSEPKKIDEICFYRFALPAAPFVADSQGVIDIDFLKNKIKALEKECDILLVEGAGGLFVPIKKDYFFVDLIGDLGRESNKYGESKTKSRESKSHKAQDSRKSKLLCALISNDKLGCIDAILSHREALARRNISFVSIVNIFDDAQFCQISYPFLKDLERNFIFQTQQQEILEFITNFIKS